jgi:photosystem II stability/assembly factor-like uncharacterized protein
MKRLRRLNGLPIWQNYPAARWTAAVLAVLLLVTTVITSGAFLAQAFNHPTTAHRVAQPKDVTDQAKKEGQWFVQSHVGKSKPAADARTKAQAQAAHMPVSPLGANPQRGATNPNVLSQAAGTWIPVGPNTFDSGAPVNGGFGVNSGRVTALAVSPSSSNEIWLGAADGGVYHSTDGGAHWTSISDTTQVSINGTPQAWPALAIGAIAVDPGNASTIYVGTGESNFNGDAYWGVGIFKSTDDGATWTELGGSQFAGLGFAKIAVDPHNSSNVIAAVGQSYANSFNFLNGGVPFGTALANMGIWQSTDGGAHWTQVISDSGDNIYGTDVVFDPFHNGVVYAGLGNVFSINAPDAGVYFSTSSGNASTWQQYTSIVPSGMLVERVGLGISQDGNTLYAAMADNDFNELASNAPNFGRLLNHAVYALDASSGAATGAWSSIDVSGVPTMVTDNGEFQWWYDLYVAVDPTDSKTFYVGGVDIFQATNGAASACTTAPCADWNNITDAYNTGSTHPDEHAMVFFSPTSRSFYFGNDGGIWSGKNTGAASFADLNNTGLNDAQFYGGSIGEQGASAQLYGGAQDNGEIQYATSLPAIGSADPQWTEVFGADGGKTAVDFTNNARVVEEYVEGDVHTSTNGGANWTESISGLCIPFNPPPPLPPGCDPVHSPDKSNFITPLVMSQSNPSTLFLATDRVYKSTNFATSWTVISPKLDSFPCTTGTCDNPLSAVAVAKSNNNVIYAGDDDGDVYHTTNGGSSWSALKFPNGGLAATGMVTSLAVDPTNSNVVYATFAGFAGSSEGTHQVFTSTDGGNTWSNISASLPNIPFEAVTVSPANHNMVVLGSDAGIFVSTNAGSTWAVLGTGMPNAAINDVFFNHTGSEIFVATHGRSMYEFTLPHIGTAPAALAATAAPNSTTQQTLTISNPGTGPLNWTMSGVPSWLSLSATSGIVQAGGHQNLTATFDSTGMAVHSAHTATLTIHDPHADNDGVTVPVTLAAVNVSTQWYFAEGATTNNFQTYLTIANPNNATAHVHVEYFLDTGANIGKDYVIAPNNRTTPNVNGDIGPGHAVSMTVTSDIGVVAERPMYFNYHGIPGGTDVLGATSLSANFAFGYVDTTANHTTFFTILNPDANNAMDAQLALYPAAGGTPITFTKTIAKASRGTIRVNTEVPGLPAGTYSATITLVQQGTSTPQNGLVERPMYLIDGTSHYTGSADVIGVSGTQTTWYFAEGATGSTFFERYILSNPCLPTAAGGCGATPTANATVTFFKPDGTTGAASEQLTAGQQKVVDVNSVLGQGVSNSATVTSDHPILAERFMSFAYHGIPGATDVLGATSPSYVFDFAEGSASSSFTEFLTIENPTSQAATVTVAFLPAGGSPWSAFTRVYTVAPNSRFTLRANDIVPANSSFSLAVEANTPIVAERPMYFTYHGTDTGGSDIIGYQP